MTRKFDLDLFVIGGGSGGVRAARMMASSGMKVAIAEDTHWGGTCVNVGCVPKKLFVYASHYSHEFEDSQAYGWDAEVSGFNWSRLLENKDREIERLNGIYIRLLENAGVSLINGRATIVDQNTVEVNGEKFTADKILIAVGGEPYIPPVEGAEYVINSDSAFYLNAFPRTISIVGGGYIACEFACIFRGLGAEVNLIYRSDLVLRGFEEDLRTRIQKEMEKQGINVMLNEEVESISTSVAEEGAKTLMLKSGTRIETSEVFYATSRSPRTKNLWSGDLNIETNAKGEIAVNSNFQTSVSSIYALGDVVGRMGLTPVATAEAMALLRHFESGEPVVMDYQNIPSAVFTTPNLATVGLTEQQVIDLGVNYKVFEADFRQLKHTLTNRDERVYIKLVVESDTDLVVGAHMMGPDAGEVIQSVAVAIKAGATKANFDETIGIHPTIAEELVTLRTPREE